MALPQVNTPTYELAVPSTDEKIKYRPFLVKEEKILLIAMESGEQESIVTAIKDIVTECTYGKVDLGSLPMFDVEYIFLQIRSKSVGEVSTFTADNTGKLTYTGATTTTVQFVASVTLDVVGTNQDLTVQLHKNGIALPSAKISRTVTSGSAGNVGFQKIIFFVF